MSTSEKPDDKQSPYPEIKEIQNDLLSLKSNIKELGQHINSDGKDYVSDFNARAKERLEKTRQDGRDSLGRLEDTVRENPGRSLAIAFASGVILSALMRRR